MVFPTSSSGHSSGHTWLRYLVILAVEELPLTRCATVIGDGLGKERLGFAFIISSSPQSVILRLKILAKIHGDRLSLSSPVGTE